MKRSALLLLGPTGVGKSPLGDLMEAKGLNGRRCFHFDFGANLRGVAAADPLPAGIHVEDRNFVRRVLSEGALLENETFYIAEHILQSFLSCKGVGEGDLVILNGLPRHAGQARDVDRLLAVERVVNLRTSAETVQDRIRLNTGGDRSERTDDSLPEISRKLEIFEARTVPLLDHYRAKGVCISPVSVGVNTTAEQLLAALEAA